jgi:hypothetical protein
VNTRPLSPLRPAAPDIADCIVNSVLLCADEFAQSAALDYWEMSAAAHQAVLDSLRVIADGTPAGSTLAAACADPANPHAVRALRQACVEQLTRYDAGGHANGWDAVASRALAADQVSRLWLDTGADHDRAAAPVGAADIPSPPPPAGRDDAYVAVIIPFRDRSQDMGRLRNLLACLYALGDQSLGRQAYRVITVEADTEPRWGGLLRDRSDAYVFVPCPGHFNKAWAVNAGVAQAAGDCDILCVLDADMLVDRHFLRRNARRFARPGAQAHWPFVDPLCLDEAATSTAISQRCLRGMSRPAANQMRGVRLRRPPGHCVWLRSPLFRRLGGFDERFEGWGGEDLDFIFRLDVIAAVDRYPDTLLHMYHPRPQIKQDGERFYAGRQLLTWQPATPIGQLTGPASSVLADVARLIERPDAGVAASARGSRAGGEG